MAKARARSKPAAPRRLPRRRHALPPAEVERDQRERLLAAVPGVVAKHGYEAMSVADIVKAAAVSRNAFHKSFSDKQDCFATAHEAGHERLFDVLATPCEAGATAEERVERALGAALGALAAEPDVARPLFVAAPSEGGVARALGAALGALAAEPDVARLLFVEAPSAGEEIALRYHEWLGRYGTLLRAAAPELPPQSIPAPEVEGVIVGGIASRIASEVLNGRAAQLPDLTAPFVEYVLAFYRLGEPGPKEGKLVSFEQGEEPASEAYEEAQRRQASA